MNFKKDYINYVLHGILQSEFYGARDDVKVRKVLEKIISVPDTAKATYLAGKTAGLELLFKYLLYISDKIDKSQVTIFNLKNNYEYDLQNLKKICGEIRNYKSAVKEEAAAEVPDNDESPEIPEETEQAGEIKEETEPSEKPEADLSEAESPDEDNQSEFTLIENNEKESADDEVFGLAGISRSVDLDLPTEPEGQEGEEEAEPQAEEENLSDEEIIEENKTEEYETEEINEITEQKDETVNTSAEKNIIGEAEEIHAEEEADTEEDDFEFEIKKEVSSDEDQHESADDRHDGSVASEVYYKFENKFFEDVKILENLFSSVSRACKGKELEKLNEKSLQRFTEIIEISSELADVTRQLEFDLTADIFYTINLLFTRAIKTPQLIFPERIKLLNSALTLVSSLIKDEDYLGHDEIVNNIELLKSKLKKPAEAPKKDIVDDKITEEETIEEPAVNEQSEKEKFEEPAEESMAEESTPNNAETEEKQQVEQEIADKKSPEKKVEEPASGEPVNQPVQDDTSSFKMKYMVKEFEKNFLNLGNIRGEYSKYEIFEAVDEMNELLRMLAKISASVKNADVLKLSEVSYVFLKYLKDYKMDLLDKEIQQIIKYIIFTYKMLLTDRKPEDFEKLVQYLNNPVKIFTDT